jgi:PAS domain S-box-containing protein
MKTSKYRSRHLSSQLAARDLQLQLAIDAAELGFWSWESLTGELVWSERCRVLLGIAPDAPARLDSFMAAIHPADREGVRDAMKASLQSKTAFSLLHRVVMPDGRTVRRRSVGRAHASVLDGKRLAMSGFLREIPEEHLVTGDVGDSGIYVVDPVTFSMTSVDDGFARLLGYRPEDLIGKPVLSVCVPEEHARIRAVVENADSEGRARTEILKLAQSGQTVPVMLDLVSVRDDGGRIRHRIATVTDLRKPVRAEAAMASAIGSQQVGQRLMESADFADNPKVAWLPTARLTLDQAFGLRGGEVDLSTSREAVERLRGQIRALISRLEDRRESERSELAGTLKSEILTCFTTIKLEIDALSRSNIISDEARRTLQLLVSETEGGLDSLRRTVFDLDPPGPDEIGFVGALERFVHDRTAPLGIRVTFTVPSEALMAPPRCLQLLYGVAQEAVNNVVRHASATQLTVALNMTAEELRLRVVDDGVGIREDDLTKSGTFGLLASSERITHSGGTLRVSCNAGRGTTLEARVPI